MKLTVYKCDDCGKILSDDKVKIPHIHLYGTISLSAPSPNPLSKEWHDKVFSRGETQICIVCLFKSLDKGYKEALVKLKDENNKFADGIPNSLNIENKS